MTQTYTIVISEKQRLAIHAALVMFISNDPGEELDEYGNDIPTSLEDMFNPLSDIPLSTVALNGLTM